MSISEKVYGVKKSTQKRIINIYKKYFTIEGTYTSLLPDKVYLKRLYRKKLNKELDLKNPITFNEKLQWIKLYDRRPEYTMMVDKYRVREYVKEKIGEEYLIPLLGVWDNPDDIDFDKLPNKFVLKCNHDSNVFICRDKAYFDIKDKKQSYHSFEEVRQALARRLKTDFYKAGREWPYKNVKRKIICEEFMQNGNDESLLDYKFFCFNGEPKYIYLAVVISGVLYIDFYDMDFHALNIQREDHPNIPKNYNIYRPKDFMVMKDIAKRLSSGIPSVRVDLYEINGKVYFGEMTFFTGGGFVPFKPEKWDKIFGDNINLERKK